MKVYVSRSQFDSLDKYQRIQGVIDYVNQLVGGLYEYDELNAEAIETYFVDYYLSQVENGGLRQFFSNSGFNPSMNLIILNGLTHMGAVHHKDIFEYALNTLISLPEPSREEVLFSPYRESIQESLQPILSTFDTLDTHFNSIPPLRDLVNEYINTITDLEIVEDDLLSEKMQVLLDSVPDYEDRFEKQRQLDIENEPAYSKIAKALCEQYEHELVSINAIDHGQDYVSDDEVLKNEMDGNYYCYLTTSKGFHYFIYNETNKTADFMQEDNQLIGTLECSNII